MRRGTWFVLVTMAAASVLVPPGGPALAQGAPGAQSSDFNGDGYADLAIGSPFEAIGSISAAGGVTILYASSGGLTANGSQFWTQNNPDVIGVPEEGDGFGFALATGDFDRDGFADLAIGSLREEGDPAKADHGSVSVLYGSPSGLTATNDQFFSQESPGIGDAAEAEDAFGSALAAGDLNGDGFADLAIGVRGEDLGTGERGEDAGALHVLYGSASGLTSAGSQFWSQNTPGVAGNAEASDLFGVSLDTGDLNGDGRQDLAVGVIGEDLGRFGDPGFVGDAGALAVLYGSGTGLSAAGNQLWTQSSPGVPGTAEHADLMGDGVAVGDLNGDGFGDLAVGVFAEDIGTILDAGLVHVLFGSAQGITTTRTQLWTQQTTGISEDPEEGDNFAVSIDIGDLNLDGIGDLALGVQGESVGSVADAGAVAVIYGSGGGPTATGNQLWTQNTATILGKAEVQDHYGTSVTIGGFGGGGGAELAVGIREDINGADIAGAVSVIYGGAGGLTDVGNQLWSQNSEGMPANGGPETRDFFGFPVKAA